MWKLEGMQKEMERLKVEKVKDSALFYAFGLFICSFIPSDSVKYVLNTCYVPITVQKRWIQ